MPKWAAKLCSLIPTMRVTAVHIVSVRKWVWPGRWYNAGQMRSSQAHRHWASAAGTHRLSICSEVYGSYSWWNFLENKTEASLATQKIWAPPACFCVHEPLFEATRNVFILCSGVTQISTGWVVRVLGKEPEHNTNCYGINSPSLVPTPLLHSGVWWKGFRERIESAHQALSVSIGEYRRLPWYR